VERPHPRLNTLNTVDIIDEACLVMFVIHPQ
jgi:hypothetical protein